MENKIISFRELKTADAEKISHLLKSDSVDYSKYFVAFTFETETIQNILNQVKKDLFIGIYWGEELIGFYMLRGFDAGFNIPSYGVYISSDYNNKGVATLSLFHGISTCKLLGINSLMLKVHVHHEIAFKMYKKYGFVQTGFDDKINNYVMHKEL